MRLPRFAVCLFAVSASFGTIQTPASAAVNSILAVSDGDDTVVRIDAPFSGAPNATQTVVAAGAPLGGSNGIARASDGTLYVGNYPGSLIVKIAPGGAKTTLTSGNLLSLPSDVVLSPDGGTLYVCSSGNNSVVKVSTSTGAQTPFASIAPQSFAMAWGPSGKLYVSSYGDGTISSLDMATGARTVYADLFTKGSWGLAFAPDGTMFVSNYIRGYVVKVLPNSTTQTALNTSGLLLDPESLALGGDGFLYVASEGNDRIVRVNLDGSGATILTQNGSFDGVSDLVLIADPTPSVVLFALQAQSLSDGVWLSWRTASESGSAGFHVYRAVRDSRGHWGRAARLTPALIAGSEALNGANADPRGGFIYSWNDPAATPSALSRYTLKGVRYWVQDVDVSGKLVNHGPINPRTGTGSISQHTNSKLVTELNR